MHKLPVEKKEAVFYAVYVYRLGVLFLGGEMSKCKYFRSVPRTIKRIMMTYVFTIGVDEKVNNNKCRIRTGWRSYRLMWVLWSAPIRESCVIKYPCEYCCLFLRPPSPLSLDSFSGIYIGPEEKRNKCKGEEEDPSLSPDIEKVKEGEQQLSRSLGQEDPEAKAGLYIYETHTQPRVLIRTSQRNS